MLRDKLPNEKIFENLGHTRRLFARCALEPLGQLNSQSTRQATNNQFSNRKALEMYKALKGSIQAAGSIGNSVSR